MVEAGVVRPENASSGLIELTCPLRLSANADADAAAAAATIAAAAAADAAVVVAFVGGYG